MSSEDERGAWPAVDTPAEVAWLRAQIEGDRARWQPVVLRYQEFAESGGIMPSPQMGADLQEAQDRLADCEAKLALVADHAGEHMCKADDDNHWDWFIGDCKVIRTLASACRHRDGYAKHWGES